MKKALVIIIISLTMPVFGADNKGLDVSITDFLNPSELIGKYPDQEKWEAQKKDGDIIFTWTFVGDKSNLTRVSHRIFLVQATITSEKMLMVAKDMNKFASPFNKKSNSRQSTSASDAEAKMLSLFTRMMENIGKPIIVKYRRNNAQLMFEASTILLKSQGKMLLIFEATTDDICSKVNHAICLPEESIQTAAPAQIAKVKPKPKFAPTLNKEDIKIKTMSFYGSQFPRSLIFNKSAIDAMIKDGDLTYYPDDKFYTYEKVLIPKYDFPESVIQVETYLNEQIISMNDCYINKLVKGKPTDITCDVETKNLFNKVIVRIKSMTFIDD